VPSKEGRKHVRIRATKKRPRQPDGRLAPLFKRLCRECGRPFTTNQPSALDCSIRCRNTFNYKRLNNDATIQGYTKVKSCPGCGALFVTTRDKRRYCYNQACSKQAKAKKDKERRTKP
jgi:predicted RNA-binding Zn ribbon-like protein